jgi:hypothetical protein
LKLNKIEDKFGIRAFSMDNSEIAEKIFIKTLKPYKFDIFVSEATNSYMKNSYIISIVIISLMLTIGFASCTKDTNHNRNFAIAEEVLRDTILQMAERNLSEVPITVTAASCPRSAGGIHDFYSEGDYWWPDSTNLDGPYVRRDGITNPNNFNDHRRAVVRLSETIGNLTSAYVITKDRKYVDAVKTHLNAWFVNEETKMNPNLLYAQAIKGRHTGRGIGIIDAIHFMEVVQSMRILERDKLIDATALSKMKNWFGEFANWLTTHPYGKKEMIHPNNHGTCWNMQVGLFARFTQNEEILTFCRDNYRNTILPTQMAEDGSYPLEMARTKPYGYSLFNLDAMVMNCVILSDDTNNLWEYVSPKGRTIKMGLEYMQPYVEDKSQWPLAPDVMYWENWPVAHPSFMLAGAYFDRSDWIHLWSRNKHFLEVEEVRRNVPIRNPLLWLEELP